MLTKPSKITSFVLCFLLIFEQSGFAQVETQNFASLHLSAYLASFHNTFTTDKYRPLHLRYLGYDAKSNDFKLLLDKGDFVGADLRVRPFNGQTQDNNNGTAQRPSPTDDELTQETKKLMKYFFIGLTLPNESFWVNLRPDSSDNTIDSALAQTDIGKILLEADVYLKKDTALYTSPQTTEGKAYWDKLYKKAEELYGYDNITIPTLTRPWIVPGEIIIRETPDNAYIYKATLKVMLEEDYLKNVGADLVSARNQDINKLYEFNDPRAKELNKYSTQLIKELIIPKLTKDINTSKRYAKLRQVYYSLILAQWFKQRVNCRGGSPYPPVNKRLPEDIKTNNHNGTAQRPSSTDIINSGNLAGLTSKSPWSKETYYEEYQKSFKDGEYNLKQPVRTPYGQTIRSYFSGGMSFDTKAISSAVKVRILPVNSDRDIANVLVSSAVNEHNFRAVFIGNPIDGKLSIVDKIADDEKIQGEDKVITVSSAVKSGNYQNKDIAAEWKKKLDLYFHEFEETVAIMASSYREIEEYRAIDDLNELLDKSLMLVSYFKVLNEKGEKLEQIYNSIVSWNITMENGLKYACENLKREKNYQKERKKMFWQRLFYKKAKKAIEAQIKNIEWQISGVKRSFQAVQSMSQINCNLSECRRDVYNFAYKDIIGKFQVQYSGLIESFKKAVNSADKEALIKKWLKTERMINRYEEIFLVYNRAYGKKYDGLIMWQKSKEKAHLRAALAEEEQQMVVLFAERNAFRVDNSFDEDAGVFLENIAISVINSHLLQYGGSLDWGYVLFRLAQSNSCLKVRLAPWLIMNSYREENSGEYPFISIHSLSDETELCKFISSFSEQEIERLRQCNIPGLMQVVESIRNNPTVFRDTKIISPIWQRLIDAYEKRYKKDFYLEYRKV